MNNRKAKLKNALAFDEFAGMKNDYVEGRLFENARLAQMHAALIEAVEVLEEQADCDDDGAGGYYTDAAREALAKIDEALKKEK